MKTFKRQAVIWLSAALLVGCGGGGGGGAIVPSGPATITAANAPTIAGAVVDATLSAILIGSIFDIEATAVSTEAMLFSRFGPLLQEATNVPIPPTTENCFVSGTVTISGDVADPTLMTLTAGDRLTFAFANCNEGDGVILNGTFELVVRSFSGNFDTGVVDLVVDTTLSNFRVTEDGEISTGSGDVTIGINTLMPPIVVLTVSGNSLAVTGGGVTATLSNYSVTNRFDGGTLSFTATTRGTLRSNEFNGSVTYTTTVEFQGNDGEDPFMGELVITGANNATITLIVLDNVNVRLEIDLDGDGAVDDTIDTTWDALGV